MMVEPVGGLLGMFLYILPFIISAMGYRIGTMWFNGESEPLILILSAVGLGTIWFGIVMLLKHWNIVGGTGDLLYLFGLPTIVMLYAATGGNDENGVWKRIQKKRSKGRK